IRHRNPAAASAPGVPSRTPADVVIDPIHDRPATALPTAGGNVLGNPDQQALRPAGLVDQCRCALSYLVIVPQVQRGGEINPQHLVRPGGTGLGEGHVGVGGGGKGLNVVQIGLPDQIRQQSAVVVEVASD